MKSIHCLLVATLVIQSLYPVNAMAAESETDNHSAEVTPDWTASDNFDRTLVAEQKTIVDVADELQNSKEGEGPKQIRNLFHLGGQTLDVFEGGADSQGRRKFHTYSMSSLTIPRIVATSFETSVKAEVNADTGVLCLAWYKNKELMARQNFNDIRVAALARHAELLFVVDQTGQTMALDMANAQKFGFQTPLPLYDLGELNARARVAGLKAGFYTRGFKPWDPSLPTLDPSPFEKPKAGDIILYVDRPDGRRQLVRPVDSASVFVGMSEGQVFFDEAASTFAANDSNAQVMAAIRKIQARQESKRKTLTGLQAVDKLAAEAFFNVPTEARLHTAKRAAINAAYPQRPRDEFTQADLEADYARIREEAQQQLNNPKYESLELSEDYWNIVGRPLRHEDLQEGLAHGDLGKSAQALDYINRNHIEYIPLFKKLRARLISANAIKSMARTIESKVNGISRATGVPAMLVPAWCLALLGAVYVAVKPEVLTEPSQAVTTLASMTVLSMFPEIVAGIGQLKAWAKGAPWNFKTGYTSISFKTFAYIGLPYYHYVVRLFRQPNLIRALQLGINPAMKVKADSDLGRELGLTQDVRVGLNNPFARGSNYADTVKRGAGVLDAVARSRARLKSIAYVLAVIAASHKSGVDPVTLALASKSGGISESNLRLLYGSKNFKSEAEDVSTELLGACIALQHPFLKEELKNLSREEITGYFDKLMTESVKIKQGNDVAMIQQGQKLWEKKANRLATFLGNWGLDAHLFLKNEIPSNYTANQSWTQFWIDYLLGVDQTELYGGRAHLNDPANLAAMDSAHGGILDTNPQQLADSSNQVAIYGITQPAMVGLNWQKAREMRETMFEPAETLSLVGHNEAEKFMSGMWSWAKLNGNLPKSRWLNMYQTYLIKRATLIQGSLLMFCLPRFLWHSQNPINVVPAFLFSFMVGMPLYAWIWPIVNTGNQLYGDKMEGQWTRLSQAKTELSQSLRAQDPARTAAATQALLRLYEEGDKNLSPEFMGQLQMTESLLRNLTSESVLQLVQAQGYEGQLADLEKAVVNGHEWEIRTAKSNLLEAFRQDGMTADEAAELDRANGTVLLDYATEHPPFATKANPWVLKVTTNIGAVTSTALAIYVNIASNSASGWPMRLLQAAGIMAAFQGGTYLLQKFADYTFPRFPGLVDRMQDNFHKLDTRNELSKTRELSLRTHLGQKTFETKLYIEQRSRQMRNVFCRDLLRQAR